MLRRVRCRSLGDEGTSLVEVLVAMILLGVALMALLGGFVVSAASVRSQKARTDGIRLALERNETLRQAPYASIADSSASETIDGLTYTYSTVTSDVDQDTAAVTAGDTVKKLTTTVSWNLKGVARSVAYTTYVADEPPPVPIPTGGGTPVVPTPPATTEAIVSMSVSPDPVVMNSGGNPNSNLLVTLVMTGFPASTVVPITWTDEDGSHTQNATSVDGSNWTTTISPGSIKVTVPTAGTSSLSLTATAGTLTRSYSLTLQGPSATPAPTYTSATVTNPINIYTSSSNPSSRRLSSKDDVTFRAVISGLDSAIGDSVKVSFAGNGGASTEVALTQDDVDATVWTTTLPRRDQKYTAGTNQAFVFSATRVSDGLTASSTVYVAVTAS